jgi:hypothetical protein
MKSVRQLTVNLLSLLIALVLVFPVSAGGESNERKHIRLNPEFKINRNSNGSVTVTSKNAGEKHVKHEFNDFYADLLMAAYRKQSIGNITETLRKKYYLTEDECRRELKHALNTLIEWKIVLRDDNLALK